MAWATRQYSIEEVDAAGDELLGPLVSEQAFAIINNWRACHNYPLNTFQVTLRRKARDIDPKALVAQRTKRLSSITSKLRRFRWLKLSEMQDIGGCRAVVSSARRVNELVRLYKQSDIKHKLDDEDDYVQTPKASGYRSAHLIYRYYSDKKETYNGLKIEMQFRSPLQHAWATAVEVVDTFTRQALKSSQGQKDWLRFFQLMGSAMAIRERTPPVPNTPTDESSLIKELHHYAEKLQVVQRLQTYGAVFEPPPHIIARRPHFFLLSLDLDAQRIRVRTYRKKELQRASGDYLEAERTASGRTDTVLVSVESLASLRRAYPNYFLDTKIFIEAVQKALARQKGLFDS